MQRRQHCARSMIHSGPLARLLSSPHAIEAESPHSHLHSRSPPPLSTPFAQAFPDSSLPRPRNPRRNPPISNPIPIRMVRLNHMHLLPDLMHLPPNLAHIRHLRMRHVLHGRRRRLTHPPRLLPSPAPLGRLLPVRCKIETDEQQQVTAQDPHPRKRRELLPRALPRVGHVREVGVGEVGVGGEVDEAEVDDELQDLQPGDVLFPPDLDAACGLEVVPVHDDVDEEVERYGDPGDGGEADELGVAEEGGGAVVVGV